MCVLQELFLDVWLTFQKRVKPSSNSLHFRVSYSLSPLPSENNPAYFMLRLGLQLYIYPVLIEHKQECLKSLRWTTAPSTSSVCLYFLQEALYLWTTEEHK